jgi:hypothetical protein
MLSPVIEVRPSGRCKGLVAPARNRWPVLGPRLCQIKHNERRVGAMRCRRESGRSVIGFGSERARGQGVSSRSTERAAWAFLSNASARAPTEDPVP